MAETSQRASEGRRAARKPVLQELEKMMGNAVKVFYVVHSINGEAASFMQYRLVKKDGKDVSEPIGTAQVCMDEGILVYLDDHILKLRQVVMGEMRKRIVMLDLDSCHISSVVYEEP